MILEEAGDGKMSTPLFCFSARSILRDLRLAYLAKGRLPLLC